MEKLSFDSGIREFEINGAVLRFAPHDPNVYARLAEAGEKIRAVEAELVRKAAGEEPNGAVVLRLLKEADRQIKDVLGWVFGAGNDFDAIFGVNVMTPCSNGERAITNFLVAITPVMQQGAEECAQRLVSDAVADAETDRALRGVTQ